MEPRKPVMSPTPGRAYPTAVKTARVPAVTPVRPDGGASRPQAGPTGVVLPMINPPSTSGLAASSAQTNSPGGISSKRTGWTTPRHPSDLAPAPPAARPPGRNARILDNGGEFQESSSPSSVGNISFWNDGAPAATSSSAADSDQDEAGQLAYMDSMYSRIQQLNLQLDRDQEMRIQNIEHHVEQRERASLEAMQRYGSHAVEDSENFGLVGAQVPLQSSHDTNAATVNRKFRPHQPRSTSPPQPAAILPKDQLELCAALGKNAELRIRAREIERQAEEASTVIEQSQRQMKMAERRIANREEKLRALLKEKLHWQSEMKDLREQVVEEKMRQVDLMRRLETNKRETTAQLDHMAQTLRDTEEDNQALRAYLIETKSHLAMQTKRFEEFVKQARDEKEKLTECIVEARGKFREWKEGEANALKAQRDQALNYLRAEYELKIARHQDEKQKLRDKVKDLEVSVRLMQKDRTLSPLELSLRKATILGSKDHAGTTEAELIEAHVRIKELEALLEHSQDFQKRQEGIIKVSEATISRLIQEREVAALDTLANQQVSGSQAWGNSALNADKGPLSLNSFSSSASALSLSPGKQTSPSRPGYSSSSARSLSQSSAHRIDPSPPPGRPKMPDQPFRPVAPSPRAHAVLSPSRQHSSERLRKNEDSSTPMLNAPDAQNEEKTSASDVNANPERATPSDFVGEKQVENRVAIKPEVDSRRAEHNEAEDDLVEQREGAKDDPPQSTRGDLETRTGDARDTVECSDATADCDSEGDADPSKSPSEMCETPSVEQSRERSILCNDVRATDPIADTKEGASGEFDASPSRDLPQEETGDVVPGVHPVLLHQNTESAHEPNDTSSADIGQSERSVEDEPMTAILSIEKSDELPSSSHSAEQCDVSDISPGESGVDGDGDFVSDLAIASSDEEAAERGTAFGNPSELGGDAELPDVLCDEHPSRDRDANRAVGGDGDMLEADSEALRALQDRTNLERDEVDYDNREVDGIVEDSMDAVAPVVAVESGELDSCQAGRETNEDQDDSGVRDDADDDKSDRQFASLAADVTFEEKFTPIEDLDAPRSNVFSENAPDSTEAGEPVVACGDSFSSGEARDGDHGTQEESVSNGATMMRQEPPRASAEEACGVVVDGDGLVHAVLSETIDRIALEWKLDTQRPPTQSCEAPAPPCAIDEDPMIANTDESSFVESPHWDSKSPPDDNEPAFDQASLVRDVSKALIDSVEHDAVMKISADLLSGGASAAEECIIGNVEAASSDAAREGTVKNSTECVVAELVEEAEDIAVAQQVVEDAEESLDAAYVPAAEIDEAAVIESHEETLPIEPSSGPEISVDRLTRVGEDRLSLPNGTFDDNTDSAELSQLEDAVVNNDDVKPSVIDSEIDPREIERVFSPVDRMREDVLEVEETWTDVPPSPSSNDVMEACRAVQSTAHRLAVAQVMATSLVIAASAQVVGTMAAKSSLQARPHKPNGPSVVSTSSGGQEEVVEAVTRGDEIELGAADHEIENVMGEADAGTTMAAVDDLGVPETVVGSSQVETAGDPAPDSHELFSSEDGATRSNAEDEPNEEKRRVCTEDVDATEEKPTAAIDHDSSVVGDLCATSQGESYVEQLRGDETLVETVANGASEDAVSCGVVEPKLPDQSTEEGSVTADRIESRSDISESAPGIVDTLEGRPEQPSNESEAAVVRFDSPNTMIAVAFVEEVEERSIERVLASLREPQSLDEDKHDQHERQVAHAFAERAVNQICEDCVAAASVSLAAPQYVLHSFDEGEQGHCGAGNAALSEKAGDRTDSDVCSVNGADRGLDDKPENGGALSPLCSTSSSPESIQLIDTLSRDPTVEMSSDQFSSVQDEQQDNPQSVEFVDDTSDSTDPRVEEITSPRVDETALVATVDDHDLGDPLEQQEQKCETPSYDEVGGNAPQEDSEAILSSPDSVEAIDTSDSDQVSRAPENVEEESQRQISNSVAIDTLSPSASIASLDSGVVATCIEEITSVIEAAASTQCITSNEGVLDSSQGTNPQEDKDSSTIASDQSEIVEEDRPERPETPQDTSAFVEVQAPTIDATSQSEQLTESVESVAPTDLQVHELRDKEETCQTEQPREVVDLEPVDVPEDGDRQASNITESLSELPVCKPQESIEASQPNESVPSGPDTEAAVDESEVIDGTNHPSESVVSDPSAEGQLPEPQVFDPGHDLEEPSESVVSETQLDMRSGEMEPEDIVPSSEDIVTNVESVSASGVEDEPRAHSLNSESGADSALIVPQPVNDEIPVDEDSKSRCEVTQTVEPVVDQEPAKAGSELSKATDAAVHPVEVTSEAGDGAANSGDSRPDLIQPTHPAESAAASDHIELSLSAPAIAPAEPPVRERVPLVIAAVEADSTSIVWTPSKTDSWQELVGGSTFNPLEMSISRPAPSTSSTVKASHPDSSRYQSAIIREQIRDPTLMAYGLKQEQATPFAMLDDKILMIDQNARHMQYDENDKVRRAASESQVTSGRVAAIEGVLVTKRKKMENEAHRKSIAYRIIPAFNYEPVLIKFQWSDFVVATPIRLMSSASQINLLNSLNGGSDSAKPAVTISETPNKTAKPQILTSPIQKMKLILKKGVKLPCGTYVIISVFNRPLEDGNENLRIQIYDAENVEEFQYDFHEDHLREYVDEWKGADDEAIAFYQRLEFRREQGSIIIKMPDKIRQSPTATPDIDAESGDASTRVFTPPPMAQLLTNLATTQPLELPPEPQYRLSPNAPASPSRMPPPLVHQATAPDRLESISFIPKIDEDSESIASSISRR